MCADNGSLEKQQIHLFFSHEGATISILHVCVPICNLAVLISTEQVHSGMQHPFHAVHYF